MALQPGATLGPFRIVEPLGRGGMASVAKAYEAALDRYVALKVLPAEFMHDPSFAERFKREAKVIASLEHPNIVPIYSFGIDDGIPWMAMRLVAGGTASGVLKQRRVGRAEAIRILEGVARALDYAHSRGIIHRDVKPQNVLLDEAGPVYLADFGIAKMVEGSTVMTATGMVTGTPEYMAPEQAQARTVDHRADIYSLGILAYQMLVGRLPFQADTPVAVVMKHIMEPLPLPTAGEVPEPVARALMKCLDKKPEARWPSASAFVAALAKGLDEAGAPGPVLEEMPTLARTATPRPATVPVSSKGTAATVPAETEPTVALGKAGPERGAPPASSGRPKHALGLGFLGIVAVAVAVVLVLRPGRGAVRPVPTAETTAARPSGPGLAPPAAPEAPQPPPPAQHVSGENPAPEKPLRAEQERRAPETATRLPQVAAGEPARPPSSVTSAPSRGEVPSERGGGAPGGQARVAALQQACDAGEIQRCNGLGWAYVRGAGVSKDEAKGASLFKRACDGGALLGCNALGWAHERGIGVARDDTRAVALYRQACDGGEMPGCSSLAWMYVRGSGVSKDEARGVELFKKACDGGGQLGCSGLGWMYARGTGVSKDDVRAADLFRRACDAQEMQGCNGLGWMYAHGTGVPKDEARAADLFKQACSGGAPAGCQGLGWLSERGLGVPKDEVRAADLFKQACDGGAMVGCTGLGRLYEEGRGVSRDTTRALALLKRACAGGDPGACDDLKR